MQQTVFYSVCCFFSCLRGLFIQLPIAWAAGNSLVFGEYILRAANIDPGLWTLRAVGFLCVTFAFLIHGTALKWGLRLQNLLGFFKIFVLFIVIGTGFVALYKRTKDESPEDDSKADYPGPSTNVSVSSICLSLYNVSLHHFEPVVPARRAINFVRSFGHMLDSAMSIMRSPRSKTQLVLCVSLVHLLLQL